MQDKPRQFDFLEHADLTMAENLLGLELGDQTALNYAALIEQQDVRAVAAQVVLGGYAQLCEQRGGSLTDDPGDQAALDPSPKALIYAYQVLSQYIDPTQLAAPIEPEKTQEDTQSETSDTWLSVERAGQILRCSQLAFPPLFVQSGLKRTAIQRDAEGNPYISAESFEHMRRSIGQLHTLQEGWVRAGVVENQLLRDYGFSLQTMSQKVPPIGNAQAIGLTTDNEVHLFYSTSHAVRLIAEARRLTTVAARRKRAPQD